MKILPNFSAPVQLTIIYLSDRNIDCFYLSTLREY
jgi:hypothetical protein